MGAGNKLLWLADYPVPATIARMAADRWNVSPYRPNEALRAQLESTDLAVVYPNGATQDPMRMSELLDELQSSLSAGVMLLPPDAQMARNMVADRGLPFLCASPDAGVDELSAKIAAAGELKPAFQNLQAQLVAARREANETRRMEQLDEEMRLAARLQRDFLPRRLPEVGPVRFAVLYQPATWVSGDIYDITRLDEKHLGFYVADAVGHGMPAALLTMFIKKALQMKRILGNSYQIVPPAVSLSELNADICQQNLSSCQFCTAVYLTLDVSTMMLEFCRAGHPEPVLIRGRHIERLGAPGSLLGIFPDEQFESRQIKLQAGDRLLLYTDGAEEIFCKTPQKGPRPLQDGLRQYLGLTREEMLLQMTADIDAASSAGPADDITVLVMDIEK